MVCVGDDIDILAVGDIDPDIVDGMKHVAPASAAAGARSDLDQRTAHRISFGDKAIPNVMDIDVLHSWARRGELIDRSTVAEAKPHVQGGDGVRIRVDRHRLEAPSIGICAEMRGQGIVRRRQGQRWQSLAAQQDVCVSTGLIGFRPPPDDECAADLEEPINVNFMAYSRGC